MKDPRKIIKERIQDIKEFFKNPSDLENRKNKITLIRISFGILYINFAIMLIQLIYVFYTLRVDKLWLNPIYGTLSIIFPFALWVYSTLFEEFNYKKNKRNKFRFCVATAILIALRYLTEPLGLLIIPYCWKIKVDDVFFSKNMVVWLARFLIIITLVLVYSIIHTNLLDIAFSEEFMESIGNFKIQHYIDFREDKEYKYDLNIMHNLENGTEFVIHENDRYTHIAAIGASGTAKTSSALLPAIYGDIKSKVRNRIAREAAIYQFISEGKGVLIGEPGAEVKCSDVKPKRKYIKELQRINEKFQDIGYCVIAPNNDITNKTYDMCVAKNIKCSVIDPARSKDGSLHPGFSSINPLYISDSVPENQIIDVISDRATMFSDVIQRITELRGSGNAYFVSVNRTCTINIAILVMGAYHYNKEQWSDQPTMLDVLNGLNNFEQLEVYVNEIEEHFLGKGVRGTQANRDANPFYTVTSYVRNVFLGETKEKISDHSTGLKIVLQEMLNSPRMRLMFSNTNPIDFDRVLAQSEFVVVNFALDMGDTLSTILGLFCVETLDQAIKRRPGTEKERQPFVLMIDELARLLTPSIETGFTLYRQYKVSMFVAYQDNSQFERIEATRMVPKVIQTLGTNIVYGRVGADMMKTYEELSGKDKNITTQKTISQTSLLDTAPSYSTSERDTPDEKSAMSGTDLRYRDFQEVTVYSVRDNRVLKPVICKLHFLPEDAYDKYEEDKPDWKSIALASEDDFIDDSIGLGLTGVDDFEEYDDVIEHEDTDSEGMIGAVIVNSENGQTASINTTSSTQKTPLHTEDGIHNAEKTAVPAKVETTSEERQPVVENGESNIGKETDSTTSSRYGNLALTGQDLFDRFTE